MAGHAVVSTASVTPTPVPLCDYRFCLMCGIRQGRRESRQQFVARLRVLFITGQLFVPPASKEGSDGAPVRPEAG